LPLYYHLIQCAEEEIAALRKEAKAFEEVRAALRTPDSAGTAAKVVFEKVSLLFLRHGFIDPALGFQQGYSQFALYDRHVAVPRSAYSPRLRYHYGWNICGQEGKSLHPSHKRECEERERSKWYHEFLKVQFEGSAGAFIEGKFELVYL
jgi:hypothetical protein